MIYVILTALCFEYVRSKYNKAETVKQKKFLLLKAGLLYGFFGAFILFREVVFINEIFVRTKDDPQHLLMLILGMSLCYVVSTPVVIVLMKVYINGINTIFSPFRKIREFIKEILVRIKGPLPPPSPGPVEEVIKSVVRWAENEYAVDSETANSELKAMLYEGIVPTKPGFLNKIGMIEYALEKVNSNEVLLTIYLIVLHEGKPLKVTIKGKTFSWAAISHEAQEHFIRSGESIKTYRIYPAGGSQ